MKRLSYLLLGQLALFSAWEGIARSGIGGLTVPTPASVAAIYLEPRFAALLARSAAATAGSAALGLAVGVLLGSATALLAHALPILRPGLDRLAVTVNAIPGIALGPIFVILVSRDLTSALLASIAVFFLIYVALSSGLRAAPPRLAEMMTAFGAGKWRRLVRLEIPCALPAFLGGVKISVTAAMIGAIVGEWFGAPSGLGIVILNTMQNFQIPLLWAAILLAAAISLAGYALVQALEAFVRARFS